MADAHARLTVSTNSTGANAVYHAQRFANATNKVTFLESMSGNNRRSLNGDSKTRGENKNGNSLGEVHVTSVVNDLDTQRNARGIVLDGLRKVESDNVRMGVKVNVKVRIGERER